MPDIGSMKYGVSTDGLQTYLEMIHAVYLKEAKDLVRNINGITNVCNNKWEGLARDNFLNNLKSDGEHLCEQFDRLYDILTKELTDLSHAMVNKDKHLID